MNLETNKNYRLRTGSKSGYDCYGQCYHIQLGTEMTFVRFSEIPHTEFCYEIERKEMKHFNFPVFYVYGKALMIPQVKMTWYPDFKNNPESKLDYSIDLMFEKVSN